MLTDVLDNERDTCFWEIVLREIESDRNAASEVAACPFPANTADHAGQVVVAHINVS